MNNIKDLTGKKIGLLNISAREFESTGIEWKCSCECGNTIVKSSLYLRTTKTPSCGCLKSKSHKKGTDGEELVGKKFDNLTVLYVNGISKTGHKMMHCRCECGNEVDVRLYNLRNGIAKSCKCRKSHNIEGEDSVIGRKVERLTIVSIDYDKAKTRPIANCVCECGNEKAIRLIDILNGKTKSCGCLKKEKFNEYYQRNDLTGRKIGLLSVIRHVRCDNRKGKNWLCNCDCGNEVIRNTDYLRHSKMASCGCFYKKKDDKGLEINKGDIESTDKRNKRGRKHKEVLGQRFGALTVIERVYSDTYKRVMWKCKCDCGNETIKSSHDLQKQKIPACDKYCVARKKLSKENKKIIDLSGNRFGALTVVERAYSDTYKRTMWRCKCDCGNEVIRSSTDIQRAKIPACSNNCKERRRASINSSFTNYYDIKRRIDYAGKKLGTLLVLERVYDDTSKYPLWRCKCDCGMISNRSSVYFRNTAIPSCGIKCVERKKVRSVT